MQFKWKSGIFHKVTAMLLSLAFSVMSIQGLPLFMHCTAAPLAEQLIMPYVVLFSPNYCFISQLDGAIAPIPLSS